MSNDVAIRVDGLGKRYLMPNLGGAGRKSRVSRYLKSYVPFTRREEDYFWALRDVSFEVKRGEILGILGKNGSGKSTMLKILSKVTPPTTGSARLKGRVGSLLEVGTGFHPELTGRENVFMSGVLLGLARSHVAAKFDQIVDFSGIEAFIDVPVKLYSSGMYVRLAYAVAALLESDILILDEVMAVGDQEFREKSQSHIESIASQGRTILFVSHNHRAVRQLCTRGIVLDHGKIAFEGSADDATSTYLKRLHQMDVANRTDVDAPAPYYDLHAAPRFYTSSGDHVIRGVSLFDSTGVPSRYFRTGGPMHVQISFVGAFTDRHYFSIAIIDSYGERVATLYSTHTPGPLTPAERGVVDVRIPELHLGEGTYTMMLDYGTHAGTKQTTHSYDCVPSAISFRVEFGDHLPGFPIDERQGVVHRSTWTVEASSARGTA